MNSKLQAVKAWVVDFLKFPFTIVGDDINFLALSAVLGNVYAMMVARTMGSTFFTLLSLMGAICCCIAWNRVSKSRAAAKQVKSSDPGTDA